MLCTIFLQMLFYWCWPPQHLTPRIIFMSHMIIQYENLKVLNAPFEHLMKQKFAGFLEKGMYILGDEVSSFEKEFGEFHNELYVVGVANGLDALILSLNCCGFKPGNEVIVPSNTYIATI